MSISKTDIEAVASLAQLNIDENSIPHMVQELSDILSFIEQMQDIDTSDVEPMPHPQDIELRLRNDQVTEPDQRTKLQALAPESEKGLYLVPKVLD